MSRIHLDEEDIAIIGTSVRLPQADSLDTFWTHLAKGNSLITKVPQERWNAEELFGNPSKGNKTNSIWGGFLPDADCFDAEFFNISPREAVWMDPQQRFSLELAWKAIEDAGYCPSSLAGSRTGVYMGVCHWDYAELIEKNLSHVDAYTPTGIAFSIIANRISHFFDFHGPSIVNDTACAASMMSIYEAVNALKSGQCDLALAGGVNLIWSPNHFISFSKSGMLSKTGSSKAFDQQADGYVRGEGGAMLLLKKAKQARLDGDPIYATIRGIGSNHGGKTNSLTITNPVAQASLISEVYRNAGIDPGSVTYIEAHGTGTPLGDPIEIAGLKQAFSILHKENGSEPIEGSCGVGSVKTNVGHLEGAAGVIGVIKVLAAMRHDALPGNVGFSEINTLIDLKGTPFRIQSELTKWVQESGKLRRAGVSAFGFGGSNAHVLLEEALETNNSKQEDKLFNSTAPLLIPLSALNDERLKAYAKELLTFIQNHPNLSPIFNLAYTMQVAREQMDCRIIFNVENSDELCEALLSFIDGINDVRVFTQGDIVNTGSIHNEIITNWLNGKLVDWNALYKGQRPERIHAPTYPFERKRYWMDLSQGVRDEQFAIHPLLHRNESRLNEQRYRSSFIGHEFFWQEHQVNSSQVLPGVVYLEMARAAYEYAEKLKPGTKINFDNVVWTKPIIAGTSPVHVDILIDKKDQHETSFQIMETSNQFQNLPNVQGRISIRLDENIPTLIEIDSLRISSNKIIESSELYSRLRSSGIHHGTTFQIVNKLYRGENFVLASIKLLRNLHNSLDKYYLHPMLLDAAIQAWICFDDESPSSPVVPFACRQIEVLAPCESIMWAVVRQSTTALSNSKLKHFDIDICSSSGVVCVRFKDLALRVMSDVTVAETLLFSKSEWKERPLISDTSLVIDRETSIFLAGFSPEIVDQVLEKSHRSAVILKYDLNIPMANLVETWFITLIDRLRDAIRLKPKLNQYFMVLVNDSVAEYLSAPLLALLKTVALENPKFSGSVITLQGHSNVLRINDVIESECKFGNGLTQIRYDEDKTRYACTQALFVPEKKSSPLLLDRDGVYWITGGGGGLALHFVESLVSAGVTKIVLSGRNSSMTSRVIDELAIYRAKGIRVDYLSCDIAKYEEVQNVIQWIETNIGPLKGVVHAAGVLRDSYILKKNNDEISKVFAPKVTGLINLDQATKALDLDFLLCCSSIASVFGNAGQADYAAANAFMASFLESRQVLVNSGQRSGASISIAWPLWKDGGMQVDQASLITLHHHFGTVPMPTYDGIKAFEQILNSSVTTPITVYFGVTEKISNLLFQNDLGLTQLEDQPIAIGSPANKHELALNLLPLTVTFLKETLADLIQMDPVKIRSNRKLEEYGLDSIIIVEMTNKLEESLGPLSKTLFFEYVDLDSVATYLIEEHGPALQNLLINEQFIPLVDVINKSEDEILDFSSADDTALEEEKVNDDTHDIAIIGLSLRVAKADDQNAFWEMLSKGQHGFEKYPEQRWDHEKLLYPERDVLGKSVAQTGAFLNGVDEFDPRYFRISQSEAELMSPEVRLFLQSAVEAFEDAGYSRETMLSKYGGDVAVIVGSMTNEYDLFGFQNMLMRGSLASGSYTGTVPNMVSYFYGFTGPSYFLDTMCSASATCVHEAVHMLRAGRCKMALAGGVSLLLHPQKLIATSQEHFTTKTAEVIRGYGVGADGTILGEGVGAIVLKTLADAKRDNDHIYAIIKGTGISNAGVRNGFTVPNPNQQARAIQEALDDAGVDPRSIGYIEGHGSGTALGDPIEIKALTQVYSKYSSDLQFCPIGTVKSNIAHLLGASGLAGIAKVLMQFKHEQLAPSLHAEVLNPNIPFAKTPFYVQRELTTWKRLTDSAGLPIPRRAGVTSIGAGGMNSHIILEEYLDTAVSKTSVDKPELLVFSAMTPLALQNSLKRLHTQMKDEPSLELSNIAFTLQVGKNELPCRLAIICDSRSSLLSTLLKYSVEVPQNGTRLYYVSTILDSDFIVEPELVAKAISTNDLDRLAQYWVNGIKIDWSQLHLKDHPKRVSLPSYPFEKIRCWYELYPDAPSVTHPLGSKLKLHPFIGVNNSDLSGMRYTTEIYLNEMLDYTYKIGRNQSVLPLVLPEIFMAAIQIAGFNSSSVMSGLTVLQIPRWEDISRLEIQVKLLDENSIDIVLNACDQGNKWYPLAYAKASKQKNTVKIDPISIELTRSGTKIIEREAWYAGLADVGMHFDPYLEVLKCAYMHQDGSVLCELMPSFLQQDYSKANIRLPSYLLGVAYQSIILSMPQGATLALDQIGRVLVFDSEAKYVLVKLGKSQEYRDILFVDEQGDISAILEDVKMLPAHQIGRLSRQQEFSLPVKQFSLSTSSLLNDTTPLIADDSKQLELELRDVVARLLKFPVSEVSARAHFFDLGFDSISLTRLATEINTIYGSSLNPSIFFECEDIQALSSHLRVRYAVNSKNVIVPTETIESNLINNQLSKYEESLEEVDQSSKTEAASSAPMAIIGMSARLPGANTPQEFFNHLLAGHDLVGNLPFERYSEPYLKRILNAEFPQFGAFLQDIDSFDAEYFNISPHEAQRMDPQQRLMLETVVHALDDAGYAPEQLPSDTGVFIGVSGHDYASLLQAYGTETDGFVATGNSLAMVANRISYKLNIHGPSQAIDTACSSSLVAILRAVESIRSGQCSTAIVGAVNLALSLEGFEGPYKAGMLSPTGRCYSFSSKADGYVRGEGVVALLIKPLHLAERDGDQIIGVLLGGAENHGGHAGSLTAPNTHAQADLIKRAMAGIDPTTIGYIETHGTGTILGDPVEINGLQQAYRSLMSSDQPIAPNIGLGSVKSNIGHLEAAAGLAGVVKVLMAMRAGELPATLHCEEINPHISLEGSPFYFVKARQEWPRKLDSKNKIALRRAAVSSFGFGGSNAHLILEEYPVKEGFRRQALPLHRFSKTRFWIPNLNLAEETVMLKPEWVLLPLSSKVFTSPNLHIIFPCEISIPKISTLKCEVFNVENVMGDISQRYISTAIELFKILQKLLQRPDSDTYLVQLVVPLDGEKELYEGLGAMLDSACAECPRLLAQVISVSSSTSSNQLEDILIQESRQVGERRIRYFDGQRFVRRWNDLANSLPVAKPDPWRDGGVYLISGGLGALGRIVAKHITTYYKNITLILLGTIPLNQERTEFISNLKKNSAKVNYHQLNLEDFEATARIVNDCVNSFGNLHGVIHCAGTHQDAAIVFKTNQQVEAVMRSKVSGAYSLDRACSNLNLDFFVMFSSLAGAVGNAGQADYAAANGFLDALASFRSNSMRSISWPLWRDGGMKVSASYEQAFFEQMGQRALSSTAGLNALGTLISVSDPNVAVIAGDSKRIRSFFDSVSSQANKVISHREFSNTADEDLSGLIDHVALHLGRLLAKLTGMKADEIQGDTPLEVYGIDSLLITNLNKSLSSTFENLSKTLFFEHRTLMQVARYLVNMQKLACVNWVGYQSKQKLDEVGLQASSEIADKIPSSRIAKVDINEPIAIVGMSGQYPNAPDLQKFWQNLAQGIDAISEIPMKRWSLQDFYNPDSSKAVESGQSYSKWGGFLEDFAKFDPLFFRIAPRDALAMDPQERLFLMNAWAACEDGGYTRLRFAQQHSSRVGVFVGITKTGYALYEPFLTETGTTVRPNTSFSSVANRVSHVFDLNGPSMPIDTMCSSSLVAIHQACASLYSGECEMAIAGGVNLYLHPSNYIELSASRMLSPDGQCKSFGDEANGFVPGEGVGCVLLKPLSYAIADGDNIHALIRSSAVNHGGKTNGYTVPNPTAQSEVVRTALDKAGIDARSVTYIEAHGTGTELGDPIEIQGLTNAFRVDTAECGFCAIGSVKSNIGHLEAAAGIAGLTKIVLQMKHGTLVPSLHAEKENPNIQFSESPFEIQRKLQPWHPKAIKIDGVIKNQSRLAGLSSFGAGGTNAHLIIEEWPSSTYGSKDLNRMPFTENRLSLPILLSAKDPIKLREMVLNLLDVLEGSSSEIQLHNTSSISAVSISEIEAVIQEAIAEILSVSKADLNADEQFTEYGITLLHLHAIRKILENRFGIVLSKTDFSLSRNIADLINLMSTTLTFRLEKFAKLDLRDIAYTLAHREQMTARLGIEVSTLAELKTKLKAFLDQEIVSGIFIAAQEKALVALNNDGDFNDSLSRLLTKGRIGKVLDFWAQGMSIDWIKLFPSLRGNIISLPTYPFSSEQFWIPSPTSYVSVAELVGTAIVDEERTALLADSLELQRQLTLLVNAILEEIPEDRIVSTYKDWYQSIKLSLESSEIDNRGALENAWALWDQYSNSAHAHGGPVAQITLAETVLHSLPSILTGSQLATSIIFPEANMSLVEAVYKEDRVASRFNVTLGSAAFNFIKQRLRQNPSKPIRILEIGGGTGSSTSILCSTLSPFTDSIKEYLFTDISRAFLIRAERNFTENTPYFKTALLNIEQPLNSQNIDLGAYDLVIASNVLHATQDMHSTLAIVRTAMADDALLLINEINDGTMFTHVTFGLLDGWWKFQDKHLRIPGTPALNTQTWRGILESSDFEWVAASPDSEQALGQQIIAVRAKSKNIIVDQSKVTVIDKTGFKKSNFSPDITTVPFGSQLIDSLEQQYQSSGLRDAILNSLSETLNIAKSSIDTKLSFADYGLDSILAVELVQKLRKSLGIDLEVTRLFDFSSVKQLESFIGSEYVGTLSKRTLAIQAFTNNSDLNSNPRDFVDETSPKKVPSTNNEKIASPISPSSKREPIAIVGMSGRFSGSKNVEELWAHLLAGHDLVRPVSRFDLSSFYKDASLGSYCDRGSFIDGVDKFDPVFFSISGLEATYMDPQQRLFLEEAWKTLESAGHAGLDMIGRRCGVFVGCSSGDYQELFASQPPGQAFWGNTSSLIPARISYFLDFKGPAIAVDTACSSSLVAVQLACQSIWSGESEMALAGGVFVQCTSRFYRYANQAQMLSLSGRCAAFGNHADGIVPGEAAAAVLLRPLADALADGDNILGVIAGVGTNQDGTTNGITAPSGVSQEQLLRQIYSEFNINPAEISMVEAHGTGTPLGDPIEFSALDRVYTSSSSHKHYCALGSVKSNLGHATTAAGITGLIKVLLAIKHERIPPTIHLDGLNPAIHLENSAFYLNDKPIEWGPSSETNRLAAISSFGFSGTNAHLVIQEPPPLETHENLRPGYLIALSTRSEAQLKQYAKDLLEFLELTQVSNCADLAFTLLAGRRPLSHRLAIVVTSLDDLRTKLYQWLNNGFASGVEMRLIESELDEEPSDLESANTIIQTIRNYTRLENEEYLNCLKQLSELFLRGSKARLDLQFDQSKHRRLALPTYPFKSDRYWVGGDIPVNDFFPIIKQGEKNSGNQNISLDLKQSSLENTSTGLVRKKVLLQPIQESDEGRVLFSISRAPDREGIRHLITDGSWSAEFQEALVRELEIAGQNEAIKAVFINGNSPWSDSGHFSVIENRLPNPAFKCSIPIVAAVKGGASGRGLMFLLLCDFVILDSHGQYGFSPLDIAEDMEFLQRYLDVNIAKKILGNGTFMTGLECQSCGTGMIAVDQNQMSDYGLEIIHHLVAIPRLSLVLLKQHMRKSSFEFLGLKMTPLSIPLEGLTSNQEHRQEISLKTTVVRLEVFDDGVAVIHMREEKQKNSFNDALMNGLIEVFERISQMPELKVLVLTGYGAYFACGGTHEGLESLQSGKSKFTDLKVYTLPIECEIPVIAAMQGHAIGAGWSLGMFCDETLFSLESIYHSNYMRFGFTPGAGATFIFPERLGDHLGREILFTAAEYRGHTLLERGVGITAVPGAEVLTQALKRAHQLARSSREELIFQKANKRRVISAHLEEIFVKELAMHEKTFIGNMEVLEKINQHFSEGTSVSMNAELSLAKQRSSSGNTNKSNPMDVRSKLLATLAEELMIDVSEISDASGFLALGLDSILAVTWIRKINHIFDLNLPATVVYKHPTVGAFIAHIKDLSVNLVAEEVNPGLLSNTESNISDEAPINSFLGKPDAAEWIRDELVKSLANELMIDSSEIRAQSTFLDLGLDSILALIWVRKINSIFDISMPATVVYTYSTVNVLAEHIKSLIKNNSLLMRDAALTNQNAQETTQAEKFNALLELDSQLKSINTQEKFEPEDLNRLKSLPKFINRESSDAIAIIGASGRFPKALNLVDFWKNISSGRDCIEEVPFDRWDVSKYYDSDPTALEKSYSKWMGSIDDIDRFDADFFNINPREAELMDPQQRLFLQHAWHVIENAAILPSELAGSQCGVFVASGNSGYSDLVKARNAYSLIGSSGSILAARIAYILDLHGPCISVDTACSSSLVAVTQACNSLLLGEVDLAIAGGACILIGPDMHIDTSKVGMLSPEGRCFAFDSRANGFVPGEGIGVVLLKRLADAERDGDPIRGIIRGWGVNQDGKTNGITAPNPQAQSRLIGDIYNKFSIDPATISLIEAHGTGTALGDPIEIEGLSEVFGDLSEKQSYCAIGSVKANVGHLLASAGIAGLLKALLALEYQKLPPSTNFKEQNSHIQLDNTPFYINQELKNWDKVSSAPRRAAISAFGFSGTNAHLVLEEGQSVETNFYTENKLPLISKYIFVLSAQTKEQLIDYAFSIKNFVESKFDISLGNLAYTLQVARQVYDVRISFVFNSREDLLEKLSRITQSQFNNDIYLEEDGKPISALFSNDEDVALLLESWFASNSVEKISQLWVSGIKINWMKLQDACLHRRIGLPGYPFARTRHWIDAEDFLQITSPQIVEEIHVMPQFSNSSKTLKGTESWLNRYEIDGEKLLPGFFYPAMALAAAEKATSKKVVGLRNLVWGSPVAINGHARELQVVIESDEHGLIYHISADGDETVAYHVGEVILDFNEGYWPAEFDLKKNLSATDLTKKFIKFSKQEILMNFEISSVLLNEMQLVAWVSQKDQTTKIATSLPLNFIWDLYSFYMMECIDIESIETVQNKNKKLATHFPFMLNSIQQDGPLPDNFIIRVWSNSANRSVNIEIFDSDGKPKLVLEGLMAKDYSNLSQIRLQ